MPIQVLLPSHPATMPLTFGTLELMPQLILEIVIQILAQLGLFRMCNDKCRHAVLILEFHNINTLGCGFHFNSVLWICVLLSHQVPTSLLSWQEQKEHILAVTLYAVGKLALICTVVNLCQNMSWWHVYLLTFKSAHPRSPIANYMLVIFTDFRLHYVFTNNYTYAKLHLHNLHSSWYFNLKHSASKRCRTLKTYDPSLLRWSQGFF